MNIIQIIIYITIIISSGYGLIYDAVNYRKESKNSMWIFYTNISNLIILIYSILSVSSILKIITNPIFEYSIMMIILITMLIYHFLLNNNMKEKEESSILFKIKNRCVHYITPILVLVNWILWKDKSNITYLSCVYWIIVPFIYLILILIRSNYINENSEKKKYPYHFLNKDIIGNKKFYINIFSILFTFVAISEIIYMLIKIL
ncbi:MAG: hypothetical protein E7311_04230 [Clostridiales bacterium]|nr:hypothetical protein [Clostridiales bacterium]